MDILERAGVSQVLPLAEMMGKALARCMVGGAALAHTVGDIDGLLIAEASVRRTPMVGRTLRENRLRDLGCHAFQGWYFSRDLPLDRLARWLRQNGIQRSAA